MSDNQIHVTVTNFRAEWGATAVNLDHMREIAKASAGSDILVFPETALTGYDNLPEIPKAEKMQIRTAETVPGPSTETLLKTAEEYGMIIIFGMIERDITDPDRVYNSAVVLKPEGETLSYRKIHLPGDEGDWASCGSSPMVFDTAWGPVGLSICYDTYSFPELIRYSRAKGARLHINCTACDEYVYEQVPFRLQLEERALTNNVYIATSGMCGPGLNRRFVGGSSIISISSESKKEIEYLAGLPFGAEGGDAEAVYSAVLDLEAIDERFNTPLFDKNARTGRPDFAPEVYARMYAELAESADWKGKCV